MGSYALSEHWSKFYAEFKKEATTDSELSSQGGENRSLLLRAGGTQSDTVIKLASECGIDIQNLEHVLKVVEEVCLVNLISVFEKFIRHCKKQSIGECNDAFKKAWACLLDPSKRSEELEAEIKTESTAAEESDEEDSGIRKRKSKGSSRVREESESSNVNTVKEEKSEGGVKAQFHCHICYQPFARLGSLHIHKRKEHKLQAEADYQCQLCGHEFYFLATMKNHIQRKHFAQRNCICPLCGKYFKDAVKCRAHRKRHAKEKKARKAEVNRMEDQEDIEPGQDTFQCHLCGWKFPVLGRLQNHIFRKHFEQKDCLCRYCGSYFSNSQECRVHVREHLRDRRNPEFKCSVCSALFDVAEALEEHMAESHPGFQDRMDAGHSMSKANMRENFSDMLCGQCGKFSANAETCCGQDDMKADGDVEEEGDSTMEDFDALEMSQSGLDEPKEELVKYCGLCNQPFETLVGLQNHIFKGHYELKDYLCRYCGKKFEDKDECRNHVNLHVSEVRSSRKHTKQAGASGKAAGGKYCCQLCGATFTLDSTLRSHRLQQHYDEKDRLCPFCGKFFETAEECGRHRRLHIGKKSQPWKQGRPVMPGSTNLTCGLCGKEFNLQGGLVTHIKRKHPEDKDFLCRYCGKHFSTVDETKKHVQEHVQQRKEFRENASNAGESAEGSEVAGNTAFSADGSIDDDSQLGEGTKEPKPVKCQVCGLEYLLSSSLKRHIAQKHPEVKDCFCHHCGLEFEDSKTCQLHMKSHYSNASKHRIGTGSSSVNLGSLDQDGLFSMQAGQDNSMNKSEPKKTWKCRLCGSELSSRKNLRDHIRILHSKQKDKVCSCCGEFFDDPEEYLKHTKQVLTCEVCDRVFKSKHQKEIHMKRHVNQKDLQCHLCGAFFFDKKGLNAHYHRHRHVKNQTFQCPHCDKSLSTSRSLKFHMRIHKNERPYVCDICGKGFTQKLTWKIHKQIHTGIKPFECEICGKRTRTKADMTRHMPIHSDKKEYVCDICGKAYRFPSGLQQHKSVHTGHRPHICEICGCTYRHSNELKKHMQTHRPGASARRTTVPKVTVTTTEIHAPNPNQPHNVLPPPPPPPNLQPVQEHHQLHQLVPQPLQQSLPQPQDESRMASESLTMMQNGPGVPYSMSNQMTIMQPVPHDHHVLNYAMAHPNQPVQVNAYSNVQMRGVQRQVNNSYSNDEMAVVVALQVLDEMS